MAIKQISYYHFIDKSFNHFGDATNVGVFMGRL